MHARQGNVRVSAISVAFAVVVAVVAGDTKSAVAQGAATLARCQQLIDLFDRYYPRSGDGTSSTGGRLDRGVSEVQCARGKYAEGIRTMEAVLKRNLIPIPPP